MRLLSYNVLADAYIRREWCPHTPDEVLEPGARTAGLIERIAGFDADVIALQEVERPVFEALETALAGYRGRWLQKGDRRPDGCATFTRAPLDRILELRYSDGTGHVALIAKVELDGRLLAIANTHARWSPPETPPAEHHGVRQLGELVARREALPWVICGDLNAGPDSAAIAAVLNAGFRDAYADQPGAFTCNSNRAVKRIDFILATAELATVAIPPPVITAETPLPSSAEPSDHLPIAVDLAWS